MRKGTEDSAKKRLAFHAGDNDHLVTHCKVEDNICKEQLFVNTGIKRKIKKDKDKNEDNKGVNIYQVEKPYTSFWERQDDTQEGRQEKSRVCLCILPENQRG